MIFVTVGTHEQPFNRLIRKIDELKRDGLIKDNVVMQTGYSTYKPQYCKWEKFFSYNEMHQYISKARIIITHGGPSTFIMPLQIGKIPIVVPRQRKFKEHVNNHQLMFVRAVSERYKDLIVIENIESLENVIINYNVIIKKMHGSKLSNNELFCTKFERIAEKLVENNKK